MFAQGRWFSPSTPASSTTKTSRHDIAEILLKVALNTKNQNQFVDNCNFVFFSFGHCVVCPSSICGFLLSFLYLQAFLT
jgi:hypothetical protein